MRVCVCVSLGSMVFGTQYTHTTSENGNPLHDNNVCIILCQELRWPCISLSLAVSRSLLRCVSDFFFLLVSEIECSALLSEYIGSGKPANVCMRSVGRCITLAPRLDNGWLFEPNDRVINDLCMCSPFTCVLFAFCIFFFIFIPDRRVLMNEWKCIDRKPH